MSSPVTTDHSQSTGLHGFTERLLYCDFNSDKSTFSKVLHVIGLIALNVFTLIALAIRACYRCYNKKQPEVVLKKQLEVGQEPKVVQQQPEVVKQPVELNQREEVFDLASWIRSRIETTPTRQELANNNEVFLDFLKISSQSSYINEIVPNLYLGGMYKKDGGLKGIVSCNFNEKKFYQTNKAVFGQQYDSWEMMETPDTYLNQVKGLVDPMEKFDAVVVLEGKGRCEGGTRVWPADDYTKEEKEVHYFTNKAEMEGDTFKLRAEKFGGTKDLEEQGKREGIDRIKASVRFIDRMISAGKRTYIHCHQGCDRSAAIVFAYLSYKCKGKKYPLTERELLDFTPRQRRTANDFPKNEPNYRKWYIDPINSAVDEMLEEDAQVL